MLSSPSSETHIRSSFDNANDNEMQRKFEITNDVEIGNTTENVAFTPPLDMDIPWEMNYHEAAIFLQVIILVICLKQ